ncbi:lipid storage droplets surface-binding protein 1 isoform X2 [Nymphalis io]|uniref:lipid storage droplets surface-binding protein 1 isoform X2 n=1 Tax=Inachis io TaxID=171585 RepID=UPI002167E33C|nr:lipid storage droplets surface-binding protein 1 isoform X2 [Nymphalis io]
MAIGGTLNENFGSYSVGVNKRAKGIVAEKAEAYLKAVKQSQQAKVTSVQRPVLPRLEALQRVANIPIVESGIGVTEKIYFRIRESNPLIRWYLTLGEKSLATGVQLALPAVQLLETPIHQFDRFLCMSLDVVEKRVPSIHLPPQAVSEQLLKMNMYSETRQYVIRRADSVKQLGTAVLDSRVTAVTANALDRALTTADKYVDKYLPPDYQDAADGMVNRVSVYTQKQISSVREYLVTSAEAAENADTGRARAAQAVQHGARLKRKLQRRLTRQALAEAKAIKEQIHVLVYVAELVATDPVLAWHKAKELYSSLSKSEPENQARPDTLEQLLVLLSRETARKIVHLINYTHSDLPNNIRQGLLLVTSHMSVVTDALLKMLPVEIAITEVRGLRSKLHELLQQLQSTSKTYLEQLAMFLAGNEEREKIAPRSIFEQRDELATINGVN